MKQVKAHDNSLTFVARLIFASAMTLLWLIVLLLVASFISYGSAALAQTHTTVLNEIGSRTLNDNWRRLNFDPLISGINTINIAWEGDADIRFSVYQELDPLVDGSDRRRIAAAVDAADSPRQWTGELDANEDYFLGIWSAAGSAVVFASISAQVPGDEPLLITNDLDDITVSEGDNATFSVTATGVGDLSHEWFFKDTPIEGGEDGVLALSNVGIDDAGNYMVVVTDAQGNFTFVQATLTVEPAADISVTASLEDLTITATSNELQEGTIMETRQGTVHSDRNNTDGFPRFERIEFDSLAAAEHTITVSWNSDADVRFNVNETDGTSILPIGQDSPVIKGSNPGIWTGVLEANTPYFVGLRSHNGGRADYTVTIEASLSLAIATQPDDVFVTEGDNAQFSVEALGNGELTYQWFANGDPLLNETEATLTVFNAQLIETGTVYTVEVSDGVDTILSEAATLTVSETIQLGLYSQETDASAWMLHGPAPTLDFNANENSDGWGRVLLRVGNLLLVGGDFVGIKPRPNGPVSHRPFMAALNAVSGQPDTSFQVPVEVDSVVRSLVLSPNGRIVYVGGDFGLLALDASSGEVQFSLDVVDGNEAGRVFDIAVTDTQLYVGGSFRQIGGEFRSNIARFSLDGVADDTWRPRVTNGFTNGRSAPVQSLAVSPDESSVYIGGNFQVINGVPVERTAQNSRISVLTVRASDGGVRPERFSPDIGNNTKGLTGHDIAVTDNYVIIAWGGPNVLTFHDLDGTRLEQYSGRGDVQALQVVGDIVFVGHHGEFFGSRNNPIPAEAVETVEPLVTNPFKFHTFRILGDGSFPPVQAFRLDGAFGVWGIAAAQDSVWIAGEISRAGTSRRSVEGLVRFPAIEQ